MPARQLTVLLRGGKRLQIGGVERVADLAPSLTIEVYAPGGRLAGTIDNVLIHWFDDESE